MQLEELHQIILIQRAAVQRRDYCPKIIKPVPSARLHPNIVHLFQQNSNTKFEYNTSPSEMDWNEL
jgi:hypothetical protein